MRGQSSLSGLQQAGKSICPFSCEGCIGVQGLQSLRVPMRQGIQQALTCVFKLEQLVDIQRGGIAHHIAGKVVAQAMAADQRMLRQAVRQTI